MQRSFLTTLGAIVLLAGPALAQSVPGMPGTNPDTTVEERGRTTDPSEATSDQKDGVAGGDMPGSRVRLSGGEREIGTITDVIVVGDKVDQVVVALDQRADTLVALDYSLFSGPHNGFYILSMTERELAALPPLAGAGGGSGANPAPARPDAGR